MFFEKNVKRFMRHGLNSPRASRLPYLLLIFSFSCHVEANAVHTRTQQERVGEQRKDFSHAPPNSFGIHGQARYRMVRHHDVYTSRDSARAGSGRSVEERLSVCVCVCGCLFVFIVDIVR